MYKELMTTNGTSPIFIEGGNDNKTNALEGGGVFIILLFLIIIAVVAIPLFNRREPIAASNSTLAEILPAMMVMSSTTRQTVDVNSNNNYNGNGSGPSNFNLYEQGVSTNENVFVQSCQTRELVREDGQETRNLVNNNRMRDLELTVAEKNAEIIALNSKLESVKEFAAISAQNTANYNELQRGLFEIRSEMVTRPHNAVCVSPYGAYHAGFARPINDGCGCNPCG